MEDPSEGEPDEVYFWRGTERFFFKLEAIKRVTRFAIVKKIVVEDRIEREYVRQYVQNSKMRMIKGEMIINIVMSLFQ